jgi:hypothetical protein
MQHTILIILSLLISATFAGWLPAFELICWLRARKQQQPAEDSKLYYALVGDNIYLAPLPGKAYEVGSPEYHAQVVGMIRALNKQLAGQGKRIPEKAAIDIIHLTSREDDRQ